MKKPQKHVYPDISQLKLRPLTNFDFREFKASVLESKESISTFLDMGLELPNLYVVDFMNYYSSMIRDKDFMHFGVFHGYKMLAYACFCKASKPDGIQIVYWVRESFLEQNIGTWTIGNMTSKAWVEMDYHFVELIIDKGNYASRKIAKKMGFEPVCEGSNFNGQGVSRTDAKLVYFFINPSLRLKAKVYNKRAIDLIGHPCMNPKFQHLIEDEIINEYFRWELPIYIEDDIVNN